MKRWLSVGTHGLHGAIAGALWFLSWGLSVFLFAQFVLYEYVEETKIRDEMFFELREWAFGFVGGLTYWLLVGVIVR